MTQHHDPQDRTATPPTGQASTTDPPSDSLRYTRVVLRPVANPFALGFLGLAGATLTTSGLELGWIPDGQRMQVALIVMIFAPPLQLLAASWEVVGVTLLVSAPGSHSAALGTVLLLAAAALLLSAGIAAMSKGVPALVLGVAGLRFLATGLYEIIGTAPAKVAAGGVGCALAALAVYGAVALEIEGVVHRPVLPTLRRGPGRTALDPDLAEQVKQVAAEPGVRTQL